MQEDSLVEARLYIPGGVTEGMIREGENEGKVLRDRVDENADAMDVDDDLENGEISTKVKSSLHHHTVYSDRSGICVYNLGCCGQKRGCIDSRCSFC